MGNDKFTLKSPRRDPSMKRVQGNFPAKKYKKGTPTITRLSFELTGSTVSYIDLARALSIVNRKMFRQGLYYYINSVEVYDNEDAVVDLFTAPDNWVTRSAHRRGKAIFDEMNEEAIKAAGNLYGKYHDFKVYLNKEHRNSSGSMSPALYGATGVGLAQSVGEWTYSKLVSKQLHSDGTNVADEFNVHICGQHATESGNKFDSVSLIKSYADTRVRAPSNGNPTVDPNLVQDPLYQLFDGSTENQVDTVVFNLDEDNDETPYQNDVYVGELANSLQHAARLHTIQTSGRVNTAAGFCAPCGLIMVAPTTSSAFRLVFNLAVGTYNGVYAERI